MREIIIGLKEKKISEVYKPSYKAESDLSLTCKGPCKVGLVSQSITRPSELKVKYEKWCYFTSHLSFPKAHSSQLCEK